MTDLSSLSSLTGTSTTTTGTSATNAANLAAGQANLSSAYSDFLTLLTTQLQNQDPTSPMDTNTFTQQLVSMTGVQQQLLTNELLQQVVNNNSSNVAGAVDLVGQNVTATSSTATLQNGQASWTYTLPSAATQGTATITNAAGTVVWSGALSSLKAGANTLTWNGASSSGVQQPSGQPYSLAVTASAQGSSITPTISISGVASGVQVVSGATDVTIAGTPVPVSSVTSVTPAS